MAKKKAAIKAAVVKGLINKTPVEKEPEVKKPPKAKVKKIDYSKRPGDQPATKAGQVKENSVRLREELPKKSVGQLSQILKEQREAHARSRIRQELDSEEGARGATDSLGDVVGTKKHQAPHGIVRARAGTGKTFTSVLGLAYAYKKDIWPAVRKNLGFDPVPSKQQEEVWEFISREKPQTARYVAFNRSIVKEFSHKYQWLVDALARVGVQFEFSTLHSMAYKLCAKTFRWKWGATTKWKTRQLLERNIWKKDLNEIWKEKQVQINATEELVGFVKVNLAYDGNVYREHQKMTIGRREMIDMATHYGIDLGGFDEEIHELVNQVLELSSQIVDVADFNDQILFPHLFDLKPWQQFDLGLVDEGQDLNPCQQELVFRFMNRVVLVGDEAQSIYGFAGADVDSIPKMEGRMEDTKRGVEGLRLTVTRRCGKEIVKEAQKIVPDFEAHESNGPGEVTEMSSEKATEAMDDFDLVLCRINAPLVSKAFRFIREGRRCHIKGRDLGYQLKSTIKNSKAEDPSQFLEWLDKFEQTEMERLKKRKNVDPDVLVAMQDRCACLRMFCEGALTLQDMFTKIDDVFQLKYEEGQEPNEGICLSSIHRAKGLEAPRVFIMRPELLPHPMAKTAWAKAQEMNLKYVAITRAIDKLIWVITDPREG